MADQSKLGVKAVSYEHHERAGRQGSVSQDAFNRRASASLEPPRNRRESIRKSFDNSNLAMVFPDKTHLEMTDTDVTDPSNSIEDMGAGLYVWLVPATASIAGSLFG